METFSICELFNNGVFLFVELIVNWCLIFDKSFPIPRISSDCLPPSTFSQVLSREEEELLSSPSGSMNSSASYSLASANAVAVSAAAAVASSGSRSIFYIFEHGVVSGGERALEMLWSLTSIGFCCVISCFFAAYYLVVTSSGCCSYGSTKVNCVGNSSVFFDIDESF